MLKFIKKSSFLLFVLMLFLSVQSPVPSQEFPCLRLVWEHDTTPYTGNGEGKALNPDSVMVDTCEASPTYDQRFANRYYIVQFPYEEYPFNFEPFHPNSTATYRDIDSAYPGYIDGFQSIENKFGNFVFLRRNTEPDSNIQKNPVFSMKFDEYVCIDSVVEALKSIENLKYSAYVNNAVHLTNVDDNKDGKSIKIFPNPSENKITIKINEINNNKNSINIYSLDGRLKISQLIQFSSETIDIDISKLINGIYYIRYDNQQTKLIIRR